MRAYRKLRERCPAHKYCGIRCSYRTTLHAPVLLELPSIFSTRVESNQSDHLSTDRAILLPYPSLDLPESRPDKSRVDAVLDRIVPSPRPRRLPAVLCLVFSCSCSLVLMRIRSKRHEAIRNPSIAVLIGRISRSPDRPYLCPSVLASCGHRLRARQTPSYPRTRS